MSMQTAMAPKTNAGSSPASAASTSASAERKVLYWYDPMVPLQKFDKPGPSPFMDMQLVPRYAEDDADSDAPETKTGSKMDSKTPKIAISNQAAQALGLRLATVEQLTLSSSVEVPGTIQFSERDISIVQAKTNGFVERVYARAVGDIINKGSPLADVLNPEWGGAQQEYLAIKQIGDSDLLRAARQRLLLLGMSADLIAQVEQRGQAIPVTTITAPNSGVLTELMVRQGMTLVAGMTLARINGLSNVWLELAVPEAQAALIANGQAVQAKLPALGDTILYGKITAILPDANLDTRTLRVRVELPNPGQRLRAGMFAQASLQGPEQSALMVPVDAVIRTGKRALVYLALEKGRYQPVEVVLGAERDDKLEIRQGLLAGQKIVVGGQFLLDSEASLRGIMALPADLNTPDIPAAAPASAPGKQP
jgi:Cu(I)/Ag(I) efflux system membrane fusion protein